MVRVIVFIFFIFSSSLVLGQTVDELKAEIEGTLRDKYGYSGLGFYTIDLEEEQYLEGLKKFKTALQKTQTVRNFNNIDTLFINNGGTIRTFEFNSKISFFFLASKPAEAFIEFISSDPDNELVYQQYLKENKERQNRALKKNFGKWFKFHEIGREILCENGEGVYYGGKIKEIAERLSGREVKDARYERIGSDDAGIYKNKFKIWLDSSSSSKIKITTYMKGLENRKLYVQIDNKEEGVPLEGRKVNQSTARFRL